MPARRTGLSHGPHGDVKVEIADILHPENVRSVALENHVVGGSPPGSQEAATDLRAAIEHLALPGGLRVMDYLDAIALWARGKRVLGEE